MKRFAGPLLVLAVVALIFAGSARAETVTYTVSGWGPQSYPSDTTPPDHAPWGPDGYPGDTIELLTHTGTLDLSVGTTVQKINTLDWMIDYTYGGTETDPDEWSDLTAALGAMTRTISFDSTPAGSLSQTGQLENTWHNDYLTLYDGGMVSFTVGGYQVDVTPLGIGRTGGSDFSGDNPWTQPQMDVMAQFDISPAAAVPEPVSMIFFGTGLVGVAGLVTRRRLRRRA